MKDNLFINWFVNTKFNVVIQDFWSNPLKGERLFNLKMLKKYKK